MGCVKSSGHTNYGRNLLILREDIVSRGGMYVGTIKINDEFVMKLHFIFMFK